MQKDLDDSCLGAIFGGHIQEARKTCRFSITPRKEALVEIAANTFKIFPANNNFSAEMLCPIGKTLVQVKMGTEVKIRPGCTLELEKHLITVDEDEEIQVDPYVASWKWDATAMFPEHPLELVNLALDNLQDLGFHNVDASDIIHHIRTRPKTPEVMASIDVASRYTWILPTLICLLMVLVGIFLYRRFRNRCQRHSPSSTYDDIIRNRNRRSLKAIKEQVAKATTIEEIANIQIDPESLELQARGEISDEDKNPFRANRLDPI
jgi:hypothetical protein